MAREIGGIEVVLELNQTKFEAGVKQATEGIERFEKNAKSAAGTLGELEDAQADLLKTLKQTPQGTKEFERLRRELSLVNSQIGNLELSFEGLDTEQRASEIKSVVGGLGDMATAAAAVSASLGGADLEQYIKKVETVERVAVGATGAMESWASLQKLIQSQNNLTSESFKNMSKAIGATTIKITAIVGGATALAVALKSIYDISEPVQDAIEGLFEGFNKSIQFIKKSFVDFIDTAIEGFNDIAEVVGFEKIEKSAREFLDNTSKDFGEFFEGIGGDEFVEAFKNNFGELQGFLKDGFKDLQAFWDSLVNRVKGTTFDDSGLVEVFDDVSADDVFEGLQEELDAQIKGLKATQSLIDSDVIKRSQKELDKLDTEIFKKQQAEFETYRGALEGGFQQIGAAAIASAIDQESAAGKIASSVAQVATNVISAMLAQAIATGIAGASNAGLATGPAAVVTTPAFIATQLGTILGAFASIPSFASGGLIQVGEAGQNEATMGVVPTNRMAEVMGGFGRDDSQGDNRVVGVISGQDILLVADRNNKSNKRLRGFNTNIS